MIKKKREINDPLKNAKLYGREVEKIIFNYIFPNKIREMQGGIKLN